MISEWRHFLEDAGTLSVATLTSSGLSVAQGLIVARWLGPSGYGTVALIMSYPALIFGLLSAKTTKVWIRHLDESSRNRSGRRSLGIVRLAVAVDLAIALTTIVAVLVTATFATRLIFDSPGFSDLLVVYSLSFIPLALQNSAEAICTIERSFGRIARANVYGSTARFAAIILLLVLDQDVAGVIVGYLLGHLVTGTYLTTHAWRIVAGTWGSPLSRQAVFPDRQTLRKIGRFLFVANLSDLSGVLVKRLDVVALGYFVPSGDVGYYRLSRSIARTFTLLIPPVRSVVYQRMVALQDQWSELMRLARRVAFFVGAPLAAIALSATLWLPPIVPSLVGEAYRPMTPILRLWLVGHTFWILFFWLRPLLFATRAEKRWLIAVSAGTASFLVAVLPLTGSFGVVGMTAARISFPIVTHLTGFVSLLRIDHGSIHR